MILEGIVTSMSLEGEVNVAPMGPIVDETMQRFILRPFRASRTFQNLRASREGVFHVTDDVELIARAALDDLQAPPPLQPAKHVRGMILGDCCRFYEFRIVDLDDREERSRMIAEVVHTGRLRDFLGFNRAKHAVVEAAILATRLHLLDARDVAAEFSRLAVWVVKTGGPRERSAFEYLQAFVQRRAEAAR